MKLNAPTVIAWWIALILFVLGIIGYIIGAALPLQWLGIAGFVAAALSALVLLVASATKNI